jgi:photosystem II stability/assembly factor-like uncharacterized protein
MRFALALAVAVALGAAAVAYAHGSGRGIALGFHPETGAIVGKREVWILGWYRCRHTTCPLALVRSTDAGRHFTRIAAPPLSTYNWPTLEFTGPRVGYAFEGGSRLYVTHDAGNSWRPFGSARVRDVAPGAGDVYVLSRSRMERSPVSHASWHSVSLPRRLRFVVSLSALGRRVWLLGSTRHIRAGDVTLRSTDRGATFASSHGPCIPELAGKLVPAGRGVVWAVCPTGMMAGLSLSTNGGRTFPRSRAFHDPGGTHLPPLTNGAQVFPVSPRTAVLYAGAEGPLFRTIDTGRRWARVRGTARFGQVYWLSFASNRCGEALVTMRSHPERASLWRTTDGGATWHSTPMR